MLHKVILGTVQFGLEYGINNVIGRPTRENTFKILNSAFDNGIRTLDTADAYGDASKLIGEFHKESGKHFNVISKFKLESGIQIKSHIEKSLKSLGVEFFEGYLFHSFDNLSQNLTFLNELKQLKREKIIRNIGVSIYTNQEFESAIDIDEIDIIQLPYNLLDNLYKRGNLISKAKSKNKIIHSRSVFLQGLFFRELNLFPLKLAPLKPYIKELLEISQKNKVTLEDLAFNYVLSNQNIDGVLFGVDNLDQLTRNILSIKNIVPDSCSYKESIDEIHVKEEELLNPVNWK